MGDIATTELPGTVTTTWLQLPQAMTYEQWVDVGRRLNRVHQGYQWWIGDYLLHGDEMFPEQASQGVEDALGAIPNQTKLNWKWVAKAIPAPQRRESLSWTHHLQVAGMDEAAREKILTKAEDLGWSVAETRQAVRQVQEAIGEREPTYEKRCEQCARSVPELRDYLRGVE